MRKKGINDFPYKEVLLHSCCAPCSAAIIERMLMSGIRPTVFYFNPNIYPREEYERRKAEAKRFVISKNLDFIDADYDYDRWKGCVSGLEDEPERGRRCLQCFTLRLTETARYASEHGFKAFTTTLASSRWKSLEQICEAGRLAASGYPGIFFWEQNWRKDGLQERRNQLLREHGFYNQQYCGCEFSMRAKGGGSRYAPILLFVYNRPRHARNMVESLLANTEAKESLLYVYADGAKGESDRTAVEEVRSFVHSIDGFGSVSITERTENLGLARNVIDGVSTIVKRHGRVIVLEDDLVVAPHFLRFMNEALEIYKDEPRVGHIQACDFTQDPTLPDTFLIRWTGSWGWATWQRAWELFRPDGAELLRELEARKLTKEFDFNGKYGYTRMLRRQVEGKNNSWAIRWNASLFLHDILSLNVGKALVQNNGFDGTGTNCGGGGLYASNLYLQPLEVKKISPIAENKEARKAYERYYARTNSFWAKAVRRIKRTLKGDFGR